MTIHRKLNKFSKFLKICNFKSYHYFLTYILFIVKGIGVILKSVSVPNPGPTSFGSRNGSGLPLNRRIPKNEGHWTGEPGNSKWIPNPNHHPHKGIYSNMNDKTWEQILKENNIDGVNFKNGEPLKTTRDAV